MTSTDSNQKDNKNNNEVMEKFAEKQSIEFTAKDLKAVSDKLTNNQDNYLSDIKDATEELKKQAYTLNKLPEKVGDQLLNVIPQISEALYTRVLEDFDRQLELRSRRFEDFNNKVEVMLKELSGRADDTEGRLSKMLLEIESTANGYIKKKALLFFLNTIFLVSISLGSTWLMMQKYPTSVFVTSGNKVQVADSDVTIVSEGGKVLNRIQEKKTK